MTKEEKEAERLFNEFSEKLDNLTPEKMVEMSNEMMLKVALKKMYVFDYNLSSSDLKEIKGIIKDSELNLYEKGVGESESNKTTKLELDELPFKVADMESYR